MENFKVIVEIDELVEVWNKQIKEVNRKLLLKYDDDKKSFNLLPLFYQYKGPEICNHVFSYSHPGNRCEMCNSLLFLEDYGDLSKNIRIEHGSLKNVILNVEDHKIPKNKEMIYKRYNGKLDQLFLNVSNTMLFCVDKFKETKVVIGESDDIMHIIALSSIFSNYGIRTRYHTSYLCNSLKIVKELPNFIGTFDGIEMTEDYVGEIINSFCMCSFDPYVVHGDQSMESLSFDIIDSEIVMYIEPSKYTTFSGQSYTGDENSDRILVLTKHNDIKFKSDFVVSGSSFYPKEYKMLDEEFVNIVPVIEEDDYSYCEYVPVSKELFDFTHKTGMSIFPPLEFYTWLIVCLCEKPFFDNMNNDLMNFLFFPEDLNRVNTEIKKEHNRKTSSKDVCNMMIKLGFKMRGDAVDLAASFFG